jgi:hypothetical protein
MKRFIEGEDRTQSTLFPEHLDDYIAEDNPVRVIDVFVDELDLNELGFEGMQLEVTGGSRIPSRLAFKDLYLRLLEPHPVQPRSRARDPA